MSSVSTLPRSASRRGASRTRRRRVVRAGSTNSRRTAPTPTFEAVRAHLLRARSRVSRQHRRLRRSGELVSRLRHRPAASASRSRLRSLMMEVGRRLGVDMHGMGMPGHFLVRPPAPRPRQRGATRFTASRCSAPTSAAPLRPRATAAALRSIRRFSRRLVRRSIVARMLANLEQGPLAQDPAQLARVCDLHLTLPDLGPEERSRRRVPARELGTDDARGSDVSARHGVVAVRPLAAPHFRAALPVDDQRVLENDYEFGVVLIERGSEVGGGDVRFDVGTIARVVQAAELPDGRYSLATVGLRRFRVVEWLPDDPFPQAEIEAIVEEPATPADAAARAPGRARARRARRARTALRPADHRTTRARRRSRRVRRSRPRRTRARSAGRATLSSKHTTPRTCFAFLEALLRERNDELRARLDDGLG